ncbi:MAG: hypothetical protein LBS50_11830 [Prevotellaceae bacterium]|jgi:hypothetical protein|nr:hypothetical protein [Prevotellaceae bacterium]
MKIKLFIVAIILSVNSFSQNSDNARQSNDFKHHSVYVELLGNSLFYSVNYDYLLKIYTDNIQMSAGSGIGFFRTSSVDGQGRVAKHNRFYITPATTFLFGAKSHYAEIGTALMVGSLGKTLKLVPSARIGYRYQRQKGGFLFRIAFTPAFNDFFIYKYWCGVSVGYIF